MIASGASVKAVQRQLGHRSATLTLDRYGHLWPNELDALAEALELAPERQLRRILRGLLRQSPMWSPWNHAADLRKCGGAGRARTCDRRIMSPLL